MAGNPNGSGAVAAGVNELAIKKIIDKVGKDHPDQGEMLSAILGASVNKIIHKSANSGAMVASSGTKNNLYHLFFRPIIMNLNLNSLDYNQAFVIETTYSTGKFAGVTIGVVVDSYGRVYDETGGAVSISDDVIPVSATIRKVTFSNIVNNSDNKANLKSAIEGLGVGAGVTINHVNISTGVSVSSNYEAVAQSYHYDLGTSTTNYGIEASGSYTSFVGSLDDPDLWDSDYSASVYKYWHEHPEENLELYYGFDGKPMLIRRTFLGIEQYTGPTNRWVAHRDFNKYVGRLYYKRVKM